MKRRIVQLAVVIVAALFLAAPAAGYDRTLADTYAQIFAPVKGPKAGKQLHLVKPDQFVKEVRQGKSYVMIDIRTPGETRFMKVNLPGHLVIPLAELFKHENLAKLPTDKPLVVVCQAGDRANAAATALRQIGFKDTYVLKGGMKGLSAYLGPKQANMPLEPKTAAR